MGKPPDNDKEGDTWCEKN